MNQISFVVRQESLRTFFGFSENEERQMDVNYFSIINKPKITIAKELLKLNVGDRIIFEIEDQGRITGAKIVVNRVYTVEPYDSVSYALVFESLSIQS